MAGGEIIVRLRPEARYVSHENTIIGNTVLYGATGGALYAAGRAGERFAVRNSGAVAVIEGLGDHGCEYMTGGRVLILGHTGRNVGAGMSGGLAWVYDPNQVFPANCNPEMIELDPLTPDDEAQIQHLLRQHTQLTGSEKAAFLLTNWPNEASRFVKVFPIEYKKVLQKARAAAA